MTSNNISPFDVLAYVPTFIKEKILEDLEIELAYHELKVKQIKTKIKDVKGDVE